MKRNIILFGVFLSAFILILVPSISCVNVSIQTENNLDTKNIDIDDIKKIRNRLKDSDCNCQKSIEQNNDGDGGNCFLCLSLYIIFTALALPVVLLSTFGEDNDLLMMLATLLAGLLLPTAGLFLVIAGLLDCYWLPY